jgi:ABC-type transport system involved in multi-copper enzyme maturation permease subunit
MQYDRINVSVKNRTYYSLAAFFSFAADFFVSTMLNTYLNLMKALCRHRFQFLDIFFQIFDFPLVVFFLIIG